MSRIARHRRDKDPRSRVGQHVTTRVRPEQRRHASYAVAGWSHVR